ncbi:MAG TPA: hypothetical protein VHM31_17705 [Polyangia bacterium]|nr:hypothetical protein [Polyangia bacterium]
MWNRRVLLCFAMVAALAGCSSGGGGTGGKGGTTSTGGGAGKGSGGVSAGGASGHAGAPGPAGTGGAAGAAGGAGAGGAAGAAGAWASGGSGGSAAGGRGGNAGTGGLAGASGGRAGTNGDAGSHADAGVSDAATAPPITRCTDDGTSIDGGTCAGTQAIAVSTNAAWAAWQDGDGPWTALPLSGGAAHFTPTGCRYGVTLACGAPYQNRTTMYTFYRTTAVTALSATCPAAGGSGGGASCAFFASQVSGTLSNVGQAGWLQTSQSWTGAKLAPVGGAATYQLSSPTGGDLAFGLAAAAGQPLTQIAVVRNLQSGGVSYSPKTVDVDFATQGRPAGSKAFQTTGVMTGDAVSDTVAWRTAPPPSPFCGAPGLNLSTSGASADDTYAVVDPALIVSGDSYTFAVTVTQAGRRQFASFNGGFTQPVDVTLPISYLNGVASVAGSLPYGRAALDFPPYPKASDYRMNTSCAATGTGSILWSVSATSEWFTRATCLELAIPDVSAASGWNGDWACPAGRAVTIDASATQKPSPVSDGTYAGAATQTGLSVTP